MTPPDQNDDCEQSSMMDNTGVDIAESSLGSILRREFQRLRRQGDGHRGALMTLRSKLPVKPGSQARATDDLLEQRDY